MTYKVIWSENALQEFETIGDWLMQKWGQQSVKKFLYQVNFIISLLSRRPTSFQKSTSYPQFRKTLVNKHTTLFFRVDADSVTIIAFWSHALNPDKLNDILGIDP